MSKVIRLNNENVRLLEEVRKAYEKYYQFKYIYKYASDNQIIRIILLDTLESLTPKKEE